MGENTASITFGEAVEKCRATQTKIANTDYELAPIHSEAVNNFVKSW
jgi:hypothetical protein